jgi:hypothetical protein
MANISDGIYPTGTIWTKKTKKSFEVDGNATPLMLKNHSAVLSLPPPNDSRSDNLWTALATILFKQISCRFHALALLHTPPVDTPAPLDVGDVVPAISAEDQHGNGYVFTNGTQFLLIATERACGSSANHKLADQRAGFLKQHGAVDNGHSHKACHSPRICFAQDAKVSPSDCAGGNGRNFGVGFGAVGQDDSAGAHIGGAHPESQLLESRQ